MKQFETGKTYSMTHIGDHDLVIAFKVVARTACMVTFQDTKTGETLKKRINNHLSEHFKAEAVMPYGQYSLAPVLIAE